MANLEWTRKKAHLNELARRSGGVCTILQEDCGPAQSCELHKLKLHDEETMP